MCAQKLMPAYLVRCTCT